jgi:hypothetical protein
MNMNITIPDDISGEERAKILELYPIIYALRFNQCFLKPTAKFLSISLRGLKDKIYRHEELKAFYNKKQIPPDAIEDPNVERDPLYKIYQFHISKGMKTFWYYQATPQERIEWLDRIKKLYSNIK